MIFNFGFSTLTGSSLTSLWQMVNILQLIEYSVLMTLYYPNIILVLIKDLDQAFFNVDFLSDLYFIHFDKSKVEGRPSWDYRFENQGVSSTNILLNSSSIFMFVIFLF